MVTVFPGLKLRTDGLACLNTEIKIVEVCVALEISAITLLFSQYIAKSLDTMVKDLWCDYIINK
jgi:hypothetical protein